MQNCPQRHVILADMCPQANLSEMILGGDSKGAQELGKLLSAGDARKTIGGYFDARIKAPHTLSGGETSYLLNVHARNAKMPKNLWLLAGDPSLEIQAQVISQISGQLLPEDAWRNVHSWLLDLLVKCSAELGGDVTVFIDCNPSFSAYTELAMIAAERLIIPCSSDGSSAHAINNIGALLYGLGTGTSHVTVGFHNKAKQFGMPLPVVHSVILNRSTQYSKRASKAFGAMFDAIKDRVSGLRQEAPQNFVKAPKTTPPNGVL